ncbi:hypothetical protein [Microvirga pakistanensis]|uniref:hypothetical protein n=1 Tax=Microvirga pakistanensis TaxID=1682650 RepID=UPI00106C4CE0|nr:hypothetical protein [Microvirga pakistanensis]
MEWKTRLAVTFKSSKGGNAVTISPIDSFTPTFSLNAEPIHSIEDTHIGVIYQPQSMTFSMTVKAIGEVAGQLTALAMDGTPFDVTLLEQNGDDWSFKSILMHDCIITSAGPSSVGISGAPGATFSGFSLRAKADPKAFPADQTEAEIP